MNRKMEQMLQKDLDSLVDDFFLTGDPGSGIMNAKKELNSKDLQALHIKSMKYHLDRFQKAADAYIKSIKGSQEKKK